MVAWWKRWVYAKIMDLHAYLISPGFQPPRIMVSLCQRLRKRITIRPLRRKQAREDFAIMRDIFNDAWSENWGFVPFSEDEFQAIARELLMLLPDDFVQIAEVDGEPVSFIVLLPNVNEAIADLDGRLLPLGWAKLLWRLKVRYPRTARIPLMGVRKKFQHTRLGPGLALSVVDALRAPALSKGLEWVKCRGSSRTINPCVTSSTSSVADEPSVIAFTTRHSVERWRARFSLCGHLRRRRGAAVAARHCAWTCEQWALAMAP